MRAWLALFALCGCRNVLGIPDETRVETFMVTLDVTGTRAATDQPIEVRLVDTYSDEQQTVKPTADGALAFPTGLLDGVDFEITTSAHCVASPREGRVATAPVAVNVLCDGYLALADPGFSAPVEIVRAGTSYRAFGSLLTAQTTLAPVAEYPDSMAVALRSGVPVGTLPFAPMPGAELTIKVTAPSSFTLEPDRLHSVVFEAGAPAQFGYGKPAEVAERAHFARAVDAHGRYLLVGAPDSANGSATLYVRQGRMWKEELVLAGMPGSRFGASVAMGNGAFVVGAPGTSQVFAYVWTGTAWTMASSDTVANAELGASLAIDKTAATSMHYYVGAPALNLVRKLTLAGAVVQTYAPPGLATGDRFGAALSISDDGRLIVGAPGDDEVYPDSGAAYLIASNGTATKRKASNPGAGDAFGVAVALSSDGGMAAVGAPFEDSGSTAQTDNSMPNAGAVYLFGTSTTAAYIKAPNADAGDAFGSALVFRRAPGVLQLLAVGAPYEDSGQTGVDKPSDETSPDAGAVYLFGAEPTPAVILGPYIKASNSGAGDQFGAALAVTADSLIVGAPYEDSGATSWNGAQGDGAVDGDNGAVYTFR